MWVASEAHHEISSRQKLLLLNFSYIEKYSILSAVLILHYMKAGQKSTYLQGSVLPKSSVVSKKDNFTWPIFLSLFYYRWHDWQHALSCCYIHRLRTCYNPGALVMSISISIHQFICLLYLIFVIEVLQDTFCVFTEAILLNPLLPHLKALIHLRSTNRAWKFIHKPVLIKYSAAILEAKVSA